MDESVETSVASEILATIYDGRTLDTWEEAVNQTTISKMCDTCLEHVHLKCEGIKSLSDIKSKFFTCGVCRDRPTAK